MADLTLDEFRGVSQEELRQILREEARKIFGSDRLKRNFGKRGKSPLMDKTIAYKREMADREKPDTM